MMALGQSYFPIIIILNVILIATSVRCENAKRFVSDFERFKLSLFSIRNLDISKTISETLFSNWTDNHDCSIELNAIKSGLINSEEWAYKGEFESKAF